MNETYREKYGIEHLFSVNKCVKCKVVPSICSIRKEEVSNKNYKRVELIGIEITCKKCDITLYKSHGYRDTFHPDDFTAKLLANEWNKKNPWED
jgi:hypothetical protein